jgi:hypothetical protein
MNLIASGQTTAKFYCYASKFHIRTAHRVQFLDGDIDIRNSILSAVYNGSVETYYNFSAAQSLKLNKVFFTNTYGLYLSFTPGVFQDVHSHYGNRGLCSYGNMTAVGLLATSVDTDIYHAGIVAKTVIAKDPEANISTVVIVPGSGIIKEQYTCNIHVSDKNGNNLSGVNVECIETGGSQVFSVATDANGDIAEQVIDRLQP